MNERKRMGKDKKGVVIPVAPTISEMSEGYLQVIDEIKKEIKSQRLSIVLKANSSMICMYWNIGNIIWKMQMMMGTL